LHLLRGFGRAEELFPIDAPRVTIGRAGAMIGIPEDPYLAPIHLVLLRDNGGLVAEDPGTQNGVFVRARGQVELKQGDEIIIGSQRMLILGLGGPTTDLRAPPAKDTRSYGSPVPKQLFLALRVLHHGPDARARAGAVILRAGPVVSIGQKDCSINFPLDPRLAVRHLDLHLNVTSVVAVDTGSAGVFVRLRSSTVLLHGDELLVGEELFRVEI
jgi:FHA domain.